jgi:glycosyltransferase involved in cell wall biosynthesis
MGAKCPVTVIPNGVDFDHFSAPLYADQRKSFRNELGFADGDIVMVTSSRLVYKNALDDVIMALESLPANYRFLILGSGPDEHALKEQVRDLALEKRVTFMGFIPHDKLPQYLHASDIFVRPSRSEGLGNSFLEAMAAGLPVIATPVGGIPDFLVNGETGFFCEVGNPKSIAQKAEKLAKDRESRDYVVERAREMVRQRYGWDNIAAGMQRILTYIS